MHAVALLGLLAACGGRQQEAPPPRPVLVERAGAAADAAVATYPGEIRAREESPLAFRIGGNLVRRHVDAGEAVKRGQLLAELDPGDQRLAVEAAQAQLSAATAELERVRADRERYAALVRDQLVSQSAMDAQEAAWKAAEERVRAARAELEVARNQAGYSRLLAPRDGVIASRQAEAGQVLAAGQTVFTLAADTGREVAIALPESRVRDVAIGQQAEVELWSEPGRRLRGTVREIAAAADPQARTYAARVALRPEDAEAVQLGQSARVHLGNGQGGALSVPLSALQPGADGGHAVWVVDPSGPVARLKPIRAGTPGETRVPVLDGLDADDWVVVAGGHLLREGQEVAPVDRGNRPVSVARSAGR
ncbi:efflux RND transporter periplasmic adaptor subunit [Luteimonas sp. J29]|uniref:efflux RND transporter periplasmic adaptor subunit n=1 Tax=Luteimonas sp. J29 TaxID=935863 RepID=UPI00047CCF25|nr:efflux RND transporter periplasmic adaptor subunit [Luteimonas sp. J29]